MALTAVLAVGTAVQAQQQRKAAKRQERAAQDARIAASADAEANRQAAQNAVERDRVAAQAEANQAQASEQMDDSADVMVADAAAESARRRQVRAQFNVGSGGASNVGSIRL